MKLSMIISAVDKASGNLGKIGAAAKRLVGRAGLSGVGRDATAASRGVDQLGQASGRAPGRLRQLLSSVRQVAGRAGMRGLELSAYGAGLAIGKTLRMTAQLAATAAKFTIGAAVAGGGFFLGGIIGLASEFEQFQVVLEKTEGSAAGARNAMAWVQEFAKKTPYEVSQVMEAFVQLRAYGIDPMGGALKALGDASSGMNQDLMAAVEALADAQTGEFERLKSFSIRAKVSGDKVAFSYQRAGKEVTRTARNSGAEIQRALTGIFDERFGGMMDRQSTTLLGMWRNLKDMVAGFQLDIANAGFFDVIKGKLQQLLEWVNKLAANGTLKAWAENISGKLSEMIEKATEFIQNTDWSKVASDIALVAGAVRDLVGWIAKLIVLAQKMPDLSWMPGVGSAKSAFGMLGRATEMMSDDAPAPKAPKLAPKPNTGSSWFPRAAPRLGPPRAIPGATGPRASTVDVGGKVVIDLRTPAGVTATVRSSRADNRQVPIIIERGRAMAGAA